MTKATIDEVIHHLTSYHDDLLEDTIGDVGLLNRLSDLIDELEREGFGLTKREEFAKAAMMGLLANEFTGSKEAIARHSVEMADALIKALNHG